MKLTFLTNTKSESPKGIHNNCPAFNELRSDCLNVLRGKKVYEPPRYMSVNEAVRQLLDVIKTRDLKGEPPGTNQSKQTRQQDMLTELFSFT